MRLIDADALLEKYNEKCDIEQIFFDEKSAKRFHTFCLLADAVEDMPTIEAEQVGMGGGLTRSLISVIISQSTIMNAHCAVGIQDSADTHRVDTAKTVGRKWTLR